MSVITYSNARKSFRELIEKVNDDSDALIITTKNNKNAVLLSEDDYNSIMETLYLKSSKANEDMLNESLEQARKSEFVKVEIDV